jgi:hypothetical protein
VFIKLKDNKIVYVFSQTQQHVFIYFILTTRFSQFTIIRPSIQNLKQGACKANNAYVIWVPIKRTNVLKYF